MARAATRLALALAVGAGLVGCDAGTPAATPAVTPGTSAEPREVNIVARDYAYVPPVVDLVPGETVVLHVINGGLVIHEAVIGSLADQVAWEAAEAPHADPPPGPTPTVEEPAGWDGVRVVAGSGQRVDVVWTVPADAATDPAAGSSAATSRATGRRAWWSRCGSWTTPARPIGTPPPVPVGSAGGVGPPNGAPARARW